MKHSEATVAVIIPTYNRAQLVGQTIDSMLNQTRPPEEIVVIDDGSTDATAEIIAAFGDRVRYVKKENAGKAAALNRAMMEVSSEYVWLMDDDDVALPNALETHLDFLAAHTDLDFSYGPHYKFSSNGPPELGPVSTRDVMAIATASPEDLFIRTMLWFPFFLQSMLVPRRCYEQVGPFDESLTFTEDYEMILRLTRHFRGGNVGAPIFCLRVHEGMRGPAHEQRSASEKQATYRHYEHRTFTRLYAELSLFDYLPRGLPPRELSELEKRQARLQRACIMSRHALFDAAFEDLNVALNSCGDWPLSERERQILVQILNVEPWWLQAHPHYAASLGRLLRRYHAHEALQACATGLRWQLARSAGEGHYREALRIGMHLWQFVGPARIPAFIARTLMQRHRRTHA